ncbi:MAG: hypothetical protein LBN05_06690 [Oscillospiraceae bacterium]|jgi:hypothetical protein|nr:hypothetical protein [Oscillospiraceae bacterium]
MDFIRSWLLSVTAAALAGMLVYILAPKGSTKKAVRTVAAVFFLTAFFLPFGQISLTDVTWSQPPRAIEQTVPAQLEETVLSQMVEAQKAVIAQIVAGEAQRLGTPPPAHIEFGTDISADGGIHIVQVGIQWGDTVQNPAALTRAIEQKIRETTGLEVQVDGQ